jgi:hypothetical protein
LRKSAAQVFAEECAAAVATRQAVFLQGAYVTSVARGLARTLGGPASARAAVPIGLQDGEQLRLCIEAALGKSLPSVGAIALEGINRAALDVTYEVLSDCLDTASTSARSRIAVFATIAKGMASLPIEPGYFELGPVFDLDFLDWRTGASGRADLLSRFLPIEADNSAYAQVLAGRADTEEASRLARLFVRKRSPSIERVFVRAYQALHLCRTDIKAATPLQSLCYGWLLPYWRILGLSSEQIDTELDGGKVNGPPVDSRLTAIFQAWLADDKEGIAP